MALILIVIYCLTAVLFLFGLTFHDELEQEKTSHRKMARSFVVLEGGKHYPAKLRRRG